MLEKMLNTLCCPLCSGELVLNTFIEESIEFVPNNHESMGEELLNKTSGRRIKEGVLLC